MTWRKSFFLWCQTLFWGRETLWQKHSSSSDFVFGRSRRSRDRGRSKVRVDERKRNRWRHRLLLATCCTVMYNLFTVQSIFHLCQFLKFGRSKPTLLKNYGNINLNKYCTSWQSQLCFVLTDIINSIIWAWKPQLKKYVRSTHSSLMSICDILLAIALKSNTML